VQSLYKLITANEEEEKWLSEDDESLWDDILNVLIDTDSGLEETPWLSNLHFSALNINSSLSSSGDSGTMFYRPSELIMGPFESVKKQHRMIN
jgi:hypothetical protein